MTTTWHSIEPRPLGTRSDIRVGSDAAAFKEGQDRFASGERPKWRLR